MRKAAAVVACLTVPLLLVFLAICVAEVVLGWMLWRNLRGAVVLSFVLLPFELLFWWGFALPFAFPFRCGEDRAGPRSPRQASTPGAQRLSAHARPAPSPGRVTFRAAPPLSDVRVKRRRPV